MDFQNKSLDWATWLHRNHIEQPEARETKPDQQRDELRLKPSDVKTRQRRRLQPLQPTTRANYNLATIIHKSGRDWACEPQPCCIIVSAILTASLYNQSTLMMCFLSKVINSSLKTLSTLYGESKVHTPHLKCELWPLIVRIPPLGEWEILLWRFIYIL